MSLLATSLFNHHHHHHMTLGGGSGATGSQASPTESQQSESSDPTTLKSVPTSEDYSAEPSPTGHEWSSDRDSNGTTTPELQQGTIRPTGPETQVQAEQIKASGSCFGGTGELGIQMNDETPVICPECGVLLQNQHFFYRHMDEEHSSNKIPSSAEVSSADHKHSSVVAAQAATTTSFSGASATETSSSIKCAECCTMFPNEMVLKYHILENHMTTDRCFKDTYTNGNRNPFGLSTSDLQQLHVSSSGKPAKCTFCHILCPNDESLRSHIQEHHVQDSAAIAGLLQLQQMTTIADHRPSTSSLKAAFANGGSSSSLSLNREHTSPARIFNPDAYCEICNKEFCNKYFLKTHKANKHGIGCDEFSLLTPTGASLSKTSPTMVPTQSAWSVVKSGSSLLQHLMQQQQFDEDIDVNKLNNQELVTSASDFCSKDLNRELDEADEPQNLSVRQPKLPKSSAGLAAISPMEAALCAMYNNERSPAQRAAGIRSASDSAADLSQNNQNQISPSSFPGLPTSALPCGSLTGPAIPKPTFPDLYCPLCRQPFASQYLLHAHFAVVHGGALSAGFNPAAAFNLQAIYASMMGLGSPMGPNPTAFLQASLNAERMKIMAAHPQASSMLGVFPPMTSLHGADPMKQEEVSPRPPAIQRPNTLPTSVSHSEPQIVNKEAFCEICRKEFCNKYFLRTHKMNKHGIVEEASPSRPNALSKSSSSQCSSPDENMSHIFTTAFSASKQYTTTNSRAGVQRPLQYTQPASSSLSDGNIPQMLLSSQEHLQQQAASNCNGLNSSASSISINNNGHELKRSHSASGTMDSTPPMKLARIESLNSPATTPELCLQQQLEQQHQSSLSRRGSEDAGSVHSQDRCSSWDGSLSGNGNQCGICLAAFPNQFALISHKVQEHTNAMDALLSSSLQHQQQLLPPGSPTASIGGGEFLAVKREHKSPTSSGSPSVAVDPDAYCEVCKKEFCSKYFLRTHKLNIHGIAMDTSPSQPTPGNGVGGGVGVQNPATTPKDSQGRPMTLTGKNFCDICNKELCNKYFLRTHMLKMHGIFIDENKTVLGNISTVDREKLMGILGYKCYICNKELSSKHFLKIHRMNAHGIREDGKSTPLQSNAGPPNVTVTPAMASLSGCGTPTATSAEPGEIGVGATPKSLTTDQALKPATELTDAVCRYFSHYTKVCPICDRRFKSSKWLRTHMWNEHKTFPEVFPHKLLTKVESSVDSVASNAEFNSENVETSENNGQSETENNADADTDQEQQYEDDQDTQNGMSTPPNCACEVCGEAFPSFTDLAIHCVSMHPESVNPDNSSSNEFQEDLLPAQKAAYNTVNASVASFMNTSNGGSPVTGGPAATVKMEAVALGNNVMRASASEQMSFLNSPFEAAAANTLSPRRLKARSSGKGSSRMHHCSFCAYGTRWLSNLYAHERRHTGDLAGDDSRQYVCQVCLKAYRYQHSLDRHVECHRYGALNLLQLQQIKQQQQQQTSADDSKATTSAVESEADNATTKQDINSGSASAENDNASSNDERCSVLVSAHSLALTTPTKSAATTSGSPRCPGKPHRCSKCQKLFTSRELCRMHIIVAHNSPCASSTFAAAFAARDSRSPPAAPVPESPRKLYRCKLCGFGSRVYDDLRSHLTTVHGIVAKQKTSSPNKCSKMPPVATITSKPDSLNLSNRTNPLLNNMAISQPASPCQESIADYATPTVPKGFPFSFDQQQKFVMQPFLMQETTNTGVFLSSVVYLPVLRNVAEPLEASFSFAPIKPNHQMNGVQSCQSGFRT